MGWKGTIRSMNAAVKRAEKQQLQVRKQQMKEYARGEVENHEERFEELTSYHVKSSQGINWSSHRDMPEPIIELNMHVLEKKAQEKLDSYTPNFFIRLLHLESWRRKQLEENIVKACFLDEINYSNVREVFMDKHNRWKINKDMAQRIFSKDVSAYEEIINRNETFMFLRSASASVVLKFINGILDVEVKVRNESVVPKYSKKLLANGSISEKEIPVSKFNSLYQDHVCSIVLRVARDVMATFPIEVCTVSAKTNIVNTSTGHIEDQFILTAYIPRENMKAINFSMVDPSDAFKNFKHRMSYKSLEGFTPVEKMKATEIIAA